MRAEGRSHSAIAKELGIAQNTAVNWSRELFEEITAIKAFKAEEMIEKYRMTQEKRIEMYGNRLLAMQDELARRDLSEVPTNKLFDMMMKCSKALEAEISKPAFRFFGSNKNHPVIKDWNHSRLPENFPEPPCHSQLINTYCYCLRTSVSICHRAFF